MVLSCSLIGSSVDCVIDLSSTFYFLFKELLLPFVARGERRIYVCIGLFIFVDVAVTVEYWSGISLFGLFGYFLAMYPIFPSLFSKPIGTLYIIRFVR